MCAGMQDGIGGLFEFVQTNGTSYHFRAVQVGREHQKHPLVCPWQELVDGCRDLGIIANASQQMPAAGAFQEVRVALSTCPLKVRVVAVRLQADQVLCIGQRPLNQKSISNKPCVAAVAEWSSLWLGTQSSIVVIWRDN